jgi:hypothetical protein
MTTALVNAVPHDLWAGEWFKARGGGFNQPLAAGPRLIAAEATNLTARVSSFLGVIRANVEAVLDILI